MKYKILWLDDGTIDELDLIREGYPVDVEHVRYTDDCEQILAHESEKYDAVILDANGVSSKALDQEPSMRDFLDLVHQAKEDCLLPLYIFSGELTRGSDGVAAYMAMQELKRIGLCERETIFFRSQGPFDMIEKIIKDIDEKYRYYRGNEYILELFSKGWLKKDLKSSFLDPLMEYYFTKNYNAAHGNQMRNLTEGMLVKINEEYSIDTNWKKANKGAYSQLIDKIKSKKFDSSETIIGPLRFMIEMANAQSHNALPDDLKKMYFEADFSTFFLVTKWFHTLMTLAEKTTGGDDKRVPENDAETGHESPTVQAATIEKEKRPQTHEHSQDGIVVPTYKEKGRTYCDLKVRIPREYDDLEKVYVTGIRVDKFNKNGWYAFCEGV